MDSLSTWYRNPAAASAARRAASPAGRLSALVSQLAQPVETDPTKTSGYRARLGALLDGLREDRTDAAGRAGALGLSPGAAMAAGAASRSRALVAGVRQATADAEAGLSADRRHRLGALMQALGMQNQMDETERARRERARAAQMGILGTLGAGLVSFIPGIGPAAAPGIKSTIEGL